MQTVKTPLACAAIVVALAMLLPAGRLGVLPALGGPTSAAAVGPAVPILLYHNVATAPRHARSPALYVTPARFRQQVTALASAGYQAVTLDQVWEAWHGSGVLPQNPVVLSFDDGYSSQYRNALPTLRGRGWPGVLNLVATNRLPGAISAAQVRGLLAAGWELDGHTVTHADLTKVNRSRLVAEVGNARTQLAARYGVPVNFMAYPYGHFDARVAQVVREAGYLGATTTRSGLATPATDPDRLPRIIVGPHTSGRALVTKLAALEAAP